MAAFEDVEQNVVFSYTVPEDIYGRVHKIPGIKVPSQVQEQRQEARRQHNALLTRVQWRTMKMPWFLSGRNPEGDLAAF